MPMPIYDRITRSTEEHHIAVPQVRTEHSKQCIYVTVVQWYGIALAVVFMKSRITCSK